MTLSDVSQHLPLSAVDFLVLLALIGRESYGYRIVKEIRERSEGRVDLLPGNLYSVLQRLERDGLIERSSRRAPAEGGPPRSYYRITPLGREVTSAEAARMKSLVDASDVRGLIEGEAR